MVELFELFSAYDEVLAALGPAFVAGRIDFSQNVQKVRTRWETSFNKAGTLRELLVTEKTRGVHKKGLADPSAANSIMWLRRGFAVVVTGLDILTAANGGNLKASVQKAYERELEPFHGWLLRRLFPAFLNALPSCDAFLSRLFGDGFAKDQAFQELRLFVAAAKPIVKNMLDLQ